jgi:hypothetical protein
MAGLPTSLSGGGYMSTTKQNPFKAIRASYDAANQPAAEQSHEETEGKSTSAQNEKTKSAQKSVDRSARGVRIRGDLVKAFKVLAAEEDRKIYEVMEEALEQYLEQHRQSKS